jgi:hypothetical protein
VELLSGSRSPLLIALHECTKRFIGLPVNWIDLLQARIRASTADTEDRRVRIIALAPRGKDLIVAAFRKHSVQMRTVFSELSTEELRALELALKKVGKRAAALMDQS